MAQQLHIVSVMRVVAHLTLLLVLALPALFVRAEPQNRQAGVNARGIVESAEITGVAEDDISEDIREAVRKMAGQRFDQAVADDLILRIQSERPEFIATTRLVHGTGSERVKVIFVVEKNNEQSGGESNINSRYTVERVEVQGFDE